MNNISSGGKRVRPPDDPSDLPSSKKTRTLDVTMEDSALSLLSFSTQMSAQASKDCQHAEHIIKALIRSESHSWDLSACAPGALFALSLNIEKSALANVKQLILPKNLHALPEMCDHMEGLVRLEMQDFLGKQLNLLKWRHLTHVSGSVSAVTEEICAQSHVDIELKTNRLTKLRCRRRQDDGTDRVHALPGQTYYKTMKGQSEPNLQSMNSLATFTGTNIPIVCRHIAAYVRPHLEAKDIPTVSENSYLGISTLADIELKIPSELNELFYAQVRSSRAFYCVSDSQFGLWANEQFNELKAAACSSVPDNEQKLSRSYFAISSNHALVLVLRYKPDSEEQFVEIMMDPNHTLTHLRQSERNPGKVKNGNFSTLIPSELQGSYFFPNTVPALLFVDSRQRMEGQSPEVNLKFVDEGFENFYPAFLCCGVPEGIKEFGAKLREIYQYKKQGARSIFNTLQSRIWEMDSFGIEHAIIWNNAATVTAHLHLVEDFLRWHATLDPYDEANQLPKDFCLQLIRPMRNLGQLYSLATAENLHSLHALIDGIHHLYQEKLISSEDCLTLLQDRFENDNLMSAALRNQDEETVRRTGAILSNLLSEGAIDLRQCAATLDPTCGDPVQTNERASWTVLRDCPSSMMNSYADLLKSLSETALFSLENVANQLSGLVYISPRDVDQQLLIPLLFPAADESSQINHLRQNEEHILADRLEQLMKALKSEPAEPNNFLVDSSDSDSFFHPKR